jgi:hypothetical protein
MKRPLVFSLLLAAAAALPIFSSAQADEGGSSISVAFARDEPPGFVSTVTGTAGVPGLARTANWNNVTGESGSAGALNRDDSGSVGASTASVIWSSNNTWATEGRGEFNNLFTGEDEMLMTGYLDTTDLAGGNFDVVTISGIDDDIAAGYSVVVYTLGGVSNRPAKYFVSQGGVDLDSKYIVPGGPTTLGAFSGPDYVAAPGSATEDPTDPDAFGNYIVFPGLFGDSVTIRAEPRDFRASINAVTILGDR